MESPNRIQLTCLKYLRKTARALGSKRTFTPQKVMSKDIRGAKTNVGYGPKADIGSRFASSKIMRRGSQGIAASAPGCFSPVFQMLCAGRQTRYGSSRPSGLTKTNARKSERRPAPRPAAPAPCAEPQPVSSDQAKPDKKPRYRPRLLGRFQSRGSSGRPKHRTVR